MVWRRALQLAAPPSRRGRFATALDLLRAANHGPIAMTAALELGHTWELSHPADDLAAEAVIVLELAVTFLGLEPTDAACRARRT